MGSIAGRLAGNLRAAGVNLDDVSAILMTHLHLDHAGGLTDVAGAPTFLKAVLYLSEAELAHWRSEYAKEAAPEVLKFSFQLARRQVTPYSTRERRNLGVTIQELEQSFHGCGECPAMDWTIKLEVAGVRWVASNGGSWA